MPGQVAPCPGLTRFQSAPGQLAGRCICPRTQPQPQQAFQSAPGQLAGRCHLQPWRQQVPTGVSIRARPIGRAMRGHQTAAGMRRDCEFQSAPGQLAGRCPAAQWQTPAFDGFNPRPANWPGDAWNSRNVCNQWLTFQSAPGQLAGRCPSSASRAPRLSGFNPRPANWPGDASARR